MLFSALLVLGLLTETQTPGQTAPRDQRPATKPGTGIIRGQVVDATSGAPIARASVRAFAPELRDNTPSAVTNDDGRFEMRDLPDEHRARLILGHVVDAGVRAAERR